MHHSWTQDSLLPDVVAIKRFHTSYRHGGNIITRDQYDEKLEAGETGLSKPWTDIGYHWVIETLSDDKPWAVRGRSMMMAGAHTAQQGMNKKGIGVCVIGNFDDAPPIESVFEYTAEFVSWLCRMYRIPTENVDGHRIYAPYKTCPGSEFDMDYFRERVADYLGRWSR
jgi:hypothetical protein